jgi:hypothetical protein
VTSSTAERSTLCADYEIGLQLEPQEAHPSVRYGARRRGRPGHMSVGQTWSASKGVVNNIVYSTVQITPAEAVRRHKLALHGIPLKRLYAAAGSLRFEIAASAFLDRKIIQETRFRA